MKNILIVTLILIFSINVWAQEKKERRSYFQIEFGYLKGVGKVKYDESFTVRNQGNAYRLRLSGGYFVNPKVSIGLGAGLDGYHAPGYNTLPIYIDAKGYLREEESTFFTFINIGSSIKLSQSFVSGAMGALGIGYRFSRRRTSHLWSVGYNLQKINQGKYILLDPVTGQASFNEAKILLNSINVNWGILF